MAAGEAAAEEAVEVGAAVVGVDSAGEEVDSAVEGAEGEEAASAVAAVEVVSEAVAEEDLEGGAGFEITLAIYDLLCKSIFVIHSTTVKHYARSIRTHRKFIFLLAFFRKLS